MQSIIPPYMSQRNSSSQELESNLKLDETIRANRQSFTNLEEKTHKGQELEKPKMTKKLRIDAILLKFEQRDKLDTSKTAEEHEFDERIYRLLDRRDVLTEAEFQALTDSERREFEDKQCEAVRFM